MESPYLLADSLHKRLGGTEVVRGVSLSVRPGEVVGFLGPNGAGKTTTLKMILGLVVPDSGTVRIAGHDPFRDSRALAQVGAVLEGNRNLYWRLSALENLEYFGVLKGLTRRMARERGLALLERFELAGRARSPAGTLSRGMQQKLALSVALVHDPKALILDEPTLGLDYESALEVESLVAQAAQAGKAILLTSHEMSLMERVSTRTVILRAGQVVADSSAAELGRAHRRAYITGLEAELDPARREQLTQLGAELNGVEIRCEGSQLWQVLKILNPLPLSYIRSEGSSLAEVFLKVIQEEP